MENSRTKNSLRNIIFGLISRIESIIFPFIIRTIFIRAIGEEYLGLNSLYSSVLQVLNLTDLGFSSAIVASMYKPLADGDITKVSALLQFYRKVYKIIGSIILAVGIILTPFIDRLISGTPPAGINIYVLWLLYLANTVISYLFFAYKVSLINATQRKDITEKIGIICTMVISTLQIIVVTMFKNVYLYVALTILNSFVYNLCCSRACDKRYPQYVCAGSLDMTTQKEISRNVSALAIQKIGSTISTSLDSIVISSFLGLAMVAIYGNYNYIVSAIVIFTNLIYGAITPSLGNSIVTETAEKNLNDLQKFSFMNTWIVSWCCVCFLCLFQDFMTIWMGKNLLLELSAVLLLVLRFYFEQIRKIILAYKDASGMWWADRWKPLAGCIVNLVLNIILVKYVGIAGVMFSTIISYSVIEIPWETHVLFKNYFKKSARQYYFNIVTATLTMLVSGGITYYLCTLISITNIAVIGIKLCICIIVPNVLFILMNWKNTQFRNSVKFVRHFCVKIHPTEER